MNILDHTAPAIVARSERAYALLTQRELVIRKLVNCELAKRCAAHYEKLASAPDADVHAHTMAAHEWARAAMHARSIGNEPEAIEHETKMSARWAIIKEIRSKAP